MLARAGGAHVQPIAVPPGAEVVERTCSVFEVDYVDFVFADNSEKRRVNATMAGVFQSCCTPADYGKSTR